MPIKRIKVNNVEHQIDYTALANLPELPPSPVKINIIDYVEDASKDDHRPAKAAAYADGKIDSVEIFRYACPERIDIDSTVDQAGNELKEPETHLSYFKDGRPIFARDGDFGYPEIDKTGQFNFRPVWNKNYLNGYVLTPVVTDINGKAHNDDKKSADYNPCYNNFKTPYLTGVDNLYRFTKVQKDINIKLVAVKESDLASNEILYKVVAPADYTGAIPSVRIFRCSDQVEKYYKYYLHPEKYETLNPDLMKGEVLEFVKQETAEGEEQVWQTSGISYDDSTGYPAKVAAKVTFLVDESAVEEGYSVVISVSPKDNYGNLNPGDFGPTKTITKINDNITVTITIAPPVSISYDDQNNKVTYVNAKGNTKLAYGIRLNPEDPEEEKNAPTSGALGASFNFKLTYDGEGTYLGYVEEKDPETKEIIAVYTDDTKTTEVTAADILLYIASITVGGVEIDKATAFEGISLEAKKATFAFKGTLVTDDIVIALAPRPVRE